MFQVKEWQRCCASWLPVHHVPSDHLTAASKLLHCQKTIVRCLCRAAAVPEGGDPVWRVSCAPGEQHEGCVPSCGHSWLRGFHSEPRAVELHRQKHQCYMTMVLPLDFDSFYVDMQHGDTAYRGDSSPQVWHRGECHHGLNSI